MDGVRRKRMAQMASTPFPSIHNHYHCLPSRSHSKSMLLTMATVHFQHLRQLLYLPRLNKCQSSLASTQEIRAALPINHFLQYQNWDIQFVPCLYLMSPLRHLSYEIRRGTHQLALASIPRAITFEARYHIHLQSIPLSAVQAIPPPRSV